MRRVRVLVVALVTGAFLALAGLAVSGGLSRVGEGTDPARLAGDQWNLELVGAPTAWATSRGEGAVVAVIDSGVDTRHPDLRDRVRATIDCVGAAGDPAACRPGGDTDPDGHGTHVAGIVAASADDGTGVAGVAPEADLLAVRALEPRPCARRPCGATGRDGDVAAGVRWAVGAGADVVNLSVGVRDSGPDTDLARAIDQAWDAGVVVVVAAGNGPERTDLGDTPAVLVSAVTASSQVAPYSATLGAAAGQLSGPGGTARAEGGDGCDGDAAVLSTLPVPGGRGDAYGCLVGTSMAAPHIAGAAALLVAIGLDAPAVVRRLLATATPLEGPVPGPPLVDAAAAVAGG